MLIIIAHIRAGGAGSNAGTWHGAIQGPCASSQRLRWEWQSGSFFS
jgi:hypothetical protein